MALIITVVVSALSVFLTSSEIVNNGVIKVLQVSEFPLYSDQFFYLFFSARVGQYPTFSMLVFIIRDGVRVLEKSYFYPGFFYDLEYPIRDDFVRLLVANVPANNSISVRMLFHEKSNLRQLDVRYGEFVSREKMNFAKDNFWLNTEVLFSRTVQLIVRTTISMNTLTNDGRTDGVVVGEPAYLICRGTGGNPKQRVLLTPGYGHKVIDEQYNEVDNEHKIQVLFQLRDHLSQYECATQDVRTYGTVHVFHHPTKMHLEPAYYSTMPNGSSVRCVPDDGYPEPKTMWYYIRGPINPDWYFNVHQDQLFLLPNTPIGSDWTFKCVAENVIPNSRPNSTFLLFKFTVIHSWYRHLVTIASSAGGVLCVLIVLVGLVVVFHARRPPRRHPVPRDEPPSRKELAFDPDTAGSIKLSQSSECVHDEAPRYEDVGNGNVEMGMQSLGCPDKKSSSKDVNHTCYV